MIVNGKKVDGTSLVFNSIDMRDYPDFSDAYIAYAEYSESVSLNDDELNLLHELFADEVHSILTSNLY